MSLYFLGELIFHTQKIVKCKYSLSENAPGKRLQKFYGVHKNHNSLERKNRIYHDQMR